MCCVCVCVCQRELEEEIASWVDERDEARIAAERKHYAEDDERSYHLMPTMFRVHTLDRTQNFVDQMLARRERTLLAVVGVAHLAVLRELWRETINSQLLQ